MGARSTLFVSFATAISIVVGTPAFARHELPAPGGRGDAAAKVECPPNQRLVGFSGRTGLWIAQIQAICAAPGAQPVAFGPRLGGPAGAPSDVSCQRGQVMTAASLNMTTRERQVSSVRFVCRSVQTGETFSQVFGSPTYVARCPGFGVGDCPYDPNTQQTCQPDETPIGFNVRYGKDVNAFGMICGRRP